MRSNKKLKHTTIKSGRHAMEQCCSGGAPGAYNCVTMCGRGSFNLYPGDWATSWISGPPGLLMMATPHAYMHAPGRSRLRRFSFSTCSSHNPKTPNSKVPSCCSIWQWRPRVDDGRSPTLNCALFFISLWYDILDKTHVPRGKSANMLSYGFTWLIARTC